MLEPTNSYFERVAENYFSNIKKSPFFNSTSLSMIVDPNLLEPAFHSKILVLLKQVEGMNIKLLPRETFRNNNLQRHYYETGLSKIKVNGMHHYGVAIDILCLDEKNEMIEDGNDNAYTVLREQALELDLHLLPRWDAGHIQAISTSEQNSLRNYITNFKAKYYIILQYGMENHYVMNLKFALSQLGYEINTDSAFFGEATDDAVKTFQRDNNLTADGIVGQQTHEALIKKGYDIKNI